MCSVPRIASITRAIERSFQFRTGSALMTRTGCLRAFLNIYIVEEREAYSIKNDRKKIWQLNVRVSGLHYSTERSGICRRIIPRDGAESVIALFYGMETNLSSHYSTERSGICRHIILRDGAESVFASFYGNERNTANLYKSNLML